MKIDRPTVIAAFMAVVGVAVVGCQSGSHGKASASRPRLFDGMGPHHRKITTASAEAQRYFDQGLTWAYAFNHDEAIRSFTRAAELDPHCAAAWWGVALCNGPHINNPVMDAEHSRRAWAALAKAQELRGGASAIEQALIDALARRYAEQPPDDRRALDEAYAAAMAGVWQTNPGDADVGVLYAESLLDLQPWDLWTPDGEPKGRTPEIVALLEGALRLNADHPGALHLYIHAVEASREPGKAAAAADRLCRLAPIAGHLVHMPSHIYARIGRWEDAFDANARAIAADRAYRKLSPQQDFYRVYMSHNVHFLTFAAMMEGRSERAVKSAREMLAEIPPEYAQANAAFMDPFMATALEALMRFGRWDEILREPAPAEYLPFTRAMWRMSRGVAHAARGDLASAEREQAEFVRAAAIVKPDAPVGNSKAGPVLEIAAKLLGAEIAFRKGEIDAAVGMLREGIVVEDSLRYDEPPDWLHPLRHVLGAILLDAGRNREAEEVYREDLRRYPENGWSLFGLARSLHANGDDAGAAEAERRFQKAWARADIKLGASCLCVAAK